MFRIFILCNSKFIALIKILDFTLAEDHGWNFDGYIIEHDHTEYCLTTGYRGDGTQYKTKKR